MTNWNRAWVAITIVLLSGAAWGQAVYLSGRVVDPTGVPVQNATVRLFAGTDRALAMGDSVCGISGPVITVAPADLAKLAHRIDTTDHGKPVTFQGALLSDVLGLAATPAGEAFKSTVASYYVLARAADGYQAVFSWAEVDPTFTDRRLYVVAARDGKPLSSAEGPLELIVPGEKRNSRWVRQLQSLAIQRVN